MRARAVPWLAAALAALAAAAAAQTLDLRLRPESEGTVKAIRSVDTATTTVAPRAATPGSPSDLSPGAPVGAVAALPLGKQSDKTWRFGAAGTPDMQPFLDNTAQEVVVAMDDGEQRVFRPRDAATFHVGQRVSVREGQLAPASLRKGGS